MELVGKCSGGLDLNNDSRTWPRFTIRLVQAAVRATILTGGLVLGASADAVGLGALELHSALGQTLQVQIGLVSPSDNDLDSRCYKAKASSLDGSPLGNVAVNLKLDGPMPALVLTTFQPVNEPALMVSVEYTCGSQTRREYQVLLDLLPVLPAAVETLRSAPTPVVAVKNPPPVAQSLPGTAGTDNQGAAKRPIRRRPAIENAPSTEYAQTPLASANESKEARRRKSPAKAFRNVLRLASDDGVDNELNDTVGMHLTLSHSLFGSNAAPEAQAPAQTQAAAQGVPPAEEPTSPPATEVNPGTPVPAASTAESGHPADAVLQELQAKIRVLEAETEELKKLNAKQLAALETARSNRIAGDGSALYLYFLLFASFVAIAWLVWRTRQIQADISHSSWHQIVPEQEVQEEHETLQTEEHAFLDHDEFEPPETKNVTQLKQVPRAATGEVEEAPAPLASQPQHSAVPAPPEEPAEGDYKFPSNVRSALPNAEEILDEIQQAEFWMDMQQPQRAIEILESNWGGERPSSPLPWLYLFDLYRMVGDEKKYAELTERFGRIFNGKVVPWGDGNALEHSRSLEEFPFLMKKITQLWPTEDLVPFLENLLIDDRDGRRQGFDLAAYRDILFLANIAYEIQSSKNVSREPQNFAEWSVI